MRNRAAAVAQHLHFDMPRVGDIALGINAAVTKSSQRLSGASGPQCGTIGAGLDHAHAAPTTAGCGLDHHHRLRAQGRAKFRQRGG